MVYLAESYIYITFCFKRINAWSVLRRHWHQRLYDDATGR